MCAWHAGSIKMNLFSEVYGCYYQVVSSILNKALTGGISPQEMAAITEQAGFAESCLFILPKLYAKEWHFLEQTSENSYASLLSHAPECPLTLLQKRWLKSLLSDERIRLFLTDEALLQAQTAFAEVEPLWTPEQFYYYDRFENGDNFSTIEYQENFRTVLEAVRSQTVISFHYRSAKGKQTQRICLPLKIEYSSKNNRFRLLALPIVWAKNWFRWQYPTDKKRYLDHFNLANIANISFPNIQLQSPPPLSPEALIQQSYDAEPVHLLITNRRNALERAMLHFANYDKDTTQIDRETWECVIYYDSAMETELLIEILSFGPVVKVTAPQHFVDLIKERLTKQMQFIRAQSDSL